MEKIRRYWNTPSRSAYVFIAPSVILLLLFNVIPLVMAFGLSFFDVPITLNTASFIGFDNFIEAFHDARFLNSLKITAIFTGLEVPIQVLGALIVAAVISKNNLKNKFLRAVYFLPVICSATVIGIMWRMILHSTTICLWLISLTASKELSILLLKLYNDGAIGISSSNLGLRVRKLD